jgi:hypothetical protein
MPLQQSMPVAQPVLSGLQHTLPLQVAALSQQDCVGQPVLPLLRQGPTPPGPHTELLQVPLQQSEPTVQPEPSRRQQVSLAQTAEASQQVSDVQPVRPVGVQVVPPPGWHTRLTQLFEQQSPGALQLSPLAAQPPPPQTKLVQLPEQQSAGIAQPAPLPAQPPPPAGWQMFPTQRLEQQSAGTVQPAPSPEQPPPPGG